MTDLFDHPVPYQVWGKKGIDQPTLDQIQVACRLPIAVAGAQMPDGHVGYGLPIGGVLATRKTVIPYAVGVDIACRMKLSITPIKANRLGGWKDKLGKALVKETRFGIGASFEKGDRREHPVMDDPDWEKVPKSIQALKGKAWNQLGTSGSGNHFVEFGEVVLTQREFGLDPGSYIALLSHSGSRGFGSNIARIYTDIAMGKTSLPKKYRQLAWLDLQSSAGEEYWLAMTLAGKYAQANHDLIHHHILKTAKLDSIIQLENHHNFAWIENLLGEEVVVHRKGATPAGKGTIGIIPGSMADPGFIVRGKGNKASLCSAAHGAGRKLSRRAAKDSLTRYQMKKYLDEKGVTLLSAGIDEAPMAYKSIHEVMEFQKDLVEIIAQFNPRIVLMSSDGKAKD